ncbi:MAG TPA: glycosyltransferase [Acidobacteriota bacterium]
MIAPQPFFTPRGTPFSILGRLRALSALGHEVELFTYPIGDDIVLPGLTVRRSWKPPGLSSVPVGPSKIKLLLDLILFGRAWGAALEGRYQLVHTHEEAAGLGALLRRFHGLRHLYDMHSSLPQQLSNFEYTRSRLLRRWARIWERWVIRESDAVIAICPALVEQVRRTAPEARPILIENRPVEELLPARPGASADALRRELELPPGKRVVVYTGTIEAYQGIDLMLEAIGRLAGQRDDFVAVIVGGTPAQVEDGRRRAAALGANRHIHWTGSRPPESMGAFLALGDILVSPRSRGTNTPLKLYSYMQAERAILATRILSHTQVLDDHCALLTEPQAEALAVGLARLLDDEPLRVALAGAVKRQFDQRYSYRGYLEATERALALATGS